MADIDTALSAPAAAAAPPPTLPTLPQSLLHEMCHYLWPADIARLANTCRGLGMDDAEAADALILPHSQVLVDKIFDYLGPADIARVADILRGLGLNDADAGAGVGGSPLIVHGLRWFRNSRELEHVAMIELVFLRLPRLKGLKWVGPRGVGRVESDM